MRGRKPTPTALHLLRGNPGKRPRPAREPRPPVVDDLAPPEWLGGEAQVEWQRLAPVLAGLGVLTATDADALAAYCEAWVTWKQATQKLRQFGLVVKSPKEGDLPVISPYVKIAHHAMGHMRSFLVEFGMTPSSRARVQVTPAAATPITKWGKLL